VDPVGGGGDRRGWGRRERRLAGRQGGQPLAELPELGVAEAGANTAGVAQRAGGVVVADKEAAEPAGAAALTRLPAADDELLAPSHLDLPPYV
jgi:hypothetical protein